MSEHPTQVPGAGSGTVKMIPALPEGQGIGQLGYGPYLEGDIRSRWGRGFRAPIFVGVKVAAKGADVLGLELTPDAQWAYNADKSTRGAMPKPRKPKATATLYTLAEIRNGTGFPAGAKFRLVAS